ncbi:hypothetical protein LXL04_012942 [Taraxacum kok-saghyz]
MERYLPAPPPLTPEPRLPPLNRLISPPLRKPARGRNCDSHRRITIRKHHFSLNSLTTRGRNCDSHLILTFEVKIIRGNRLQERQVTEIRSFHISKKTPPSIHHHSHYQLSQNPRFLLG